MRTRSQTAPLVAGEATAGSSKPALAPKGGGQADLSKRSLAGRGPAPAGRSQSPSQHHLLLMRPPSQSWHTGSHSEVKLYCHTDVLARSWRLCAKKPAPQGDMAGGAGAEGGRPSETLTPGCPEWYPAPELGGWFVLRKDSSPGEPLGAPGRVEGASAATGMTPAPRRPRVQRSAVQANGHQQLFQHPQALCSLLHGMAGLHQAAHVESDVVHQRDGVRLLPAGHSRGLLPHGLHKVLLLHQLWTGRIRVCPPPRPSRPGPTLTFSMTLAMYLVHWSSRRARPNSLATRHTPTTLSSSSSWAKLRPHSCFRPGSRYMSATLSTS